METQVPIGTLSLRPSTAGSLHRALIQLSTLQRTYRQNRLWKTIGDLCDKEPLFRFVRICHWVSNRDPLSGDGQRLEIPHKIICLPDDRGSRFTWEIARISLKRALRLVESCSWCQYFDDFTLKHCDQLLVLNLPSLRYSSRLMADVNLIIFKMATLQNQI